MIEQASLVIGEGNWAVKSDSLLGYKINNGKYYPREMSVVRATTGTRINEDGLVEVVPYNLFQYSEQFNNWSTQQGGTISSNVATAPDGTLTADLLYATTNNTIQAAIQLISTINGAAYTQSIYVKSSGKNFAALYTLNGGSGTTMWVNLTSGAITNGAGVNVTNRFAENVGNGWWRIGFTDLGNGSFGFMHIFPTDAANTNTATANGTDGILIWGGQLVEGSSALDYLPTTDRLDVARIDYSSGSAALLVEPQRTNLIAYSSSFDNAAWTKAYTAVSANSIVSPSGIQDADLIYPTASGINHGVYQYNAGISSVVGTISCYVKSAGKNWALLGTDNTSPYNVSFDLVNGVVGSLPSGYTATITNVGNGWFKITATFQSGSSLPYPFVGVADNTNRSVTPNGTDGIFVWGFQVELGSYGTSYIPTQGSTVTRNADVISKTGIADLIGQTEGTLYIDTYIDNISAQTNDPVLIFLRGTSAETYIQVYDNGSARVIHYNGTTQCNILSSSGLLTNGRHKFAFGYKANDFVFYIDGVLIGTDTSGSVGAQSELGLQYYNSAFYGIQNVNSTAVFKTRLTNAELATLTTI